MQQEKAMEETLFDKFGNPVAYIDHLSSEQPIFLWNGTPVCYLSNGQIYGYNGSHLGWFANGIVYDLDGREVGYNKSSLRVFPRYEPFKSFKQFKPFRSFREFAHYRPSFSRLQSDVSLSLFLSRGRY